ncbi:hypothetical protein SK571_31140 [Lentzea sp. BCCO 10_0798]|uniref:DUF4760 domain-containing protein n=1 Tax=Lentzea kristufekii TaxID=3095430 RepID=A0ABU4U153_9PSEU|nr:hypothetical protein [Lentzea sp. BCCO 10_0798]MDX8053847.1 hypothetical protein [Lentzea sp. BCCO 10_0798]
MPQGQVSVWVPIIVGLLGLAGVIAAQFVNAWRERKRITLEQEYEGRVHWRDRRIDAYADFLAAVEDWYDAILRLETANAIDGAEDGPFTDEDALQARCREQSKASARLLARLDLISTSEVCVAAHSIRLNLREWSGEVESGRWPDSRAGADDPSAGIAEEFDRLLTALRTDLGIDVDSRYQPVRHRF